MVSRVICCFSIDPFQNISAFLEYGMVISFIFWMILFLIQFLFLDGMKLFVKRILKNIAH